MPASKAQQKAVTKYVKAKYDRFGLTMPKGNLDTIKARFAAGGISLHPDTVKAAQEAAEATGEAVPQFVDRAVLETAERDRMTREGG